MKLISLTLIYLKITKLIIFCYLDINSVRNKFTDLQTIINKNVDLVSIAKTKLDASFPSAQFTLEGYHTPYRLDVNNKSGGYNCICKIFNSMTLPLL